MAAMTYALTDSRIMLRRNLRRMVRYPSMTLLLLGMPVVFLLLFVYVLGGTLGTGLGGASSGRAGYANYVAPGILIMAVAAAAQGTAISVAMDMTEGIIARFRTMAIFRPAILAGHVFGALIQSALCVGIVFLTALLVGFRPNASPLELLGAFGMLMLLALALTWLTVGLGLVSRSVESASNSPMILTLLPFIGSGFVPTDSMPTGLRWFAAHQPFTPITETVRGLLVGDHIGSSGFVAVAWCVGITLVAFVWSCRAFERSRATE